MTDKQIIIDGVDVNDCHNRTFYKNDEGDVQCKCYRFEDADSDTLLFGICKQHPHCYYKQLKRKEQECEELKKLLKVRIEDLCDSCGASSMMPMPCKVYEKTLTEIKEIAESEMDSKEFMAVQCMLNGSVDNKNKVLEQILQKISEVENE